MRFLLGGFGSRGDVQPMVALALALRARGHEATLVATSDFEGWARDLNLPFVSCGLSMQRVLESSADSGTAMLRAVREFVRGHFRLLEPLVADCDVVAASSMTAAGASLAEKHGKRYHAVWMCPQAVPSAWHGPPHWTSAPAWHAPLPRWATRAVWSVYVRSANALMLREPVNAERARLGLPPVQDAYRHMVLQRLLLACDPVLAPLPPDVGADLATQTGAWFLPETEALPAPVEEFLAAGPPPVFMGLGSMSDRDPERTTRVLLQAARSAGVRVLLSRGWAGLGGRDLPAGVLEIGPVPHGRLFPRCAAVVHHGGAGTTTTAARAGVPQVVVPHYGDQFYWARRVHALGLGPKAIPKARLRPDALAAALRACVEDEALRRTAFGFPNAIRTDGLARAVEILEGGAATESRTA